MRSKSDTARAKFDWTAKTVTLQAKEGAAETKPLPADIQDIMSRHIDAAALQERDDMKKLNTDVQAKLVAAGVKFNDIDIAPFRAKLKQEGYYKDWRAKIGEEAWLALEKTTGPLA